jgi:hypothetical protein
MTDNTRIYREEKARLDADYAANIDASGSRVIKDDSAFHLAIDPLWCKQQERLKALRARFPAYSFEWDLAP